MNKIRFCATYQKGKRIVEVYTYSNGMFGASIKDINTGLVESATTAQTRANRTAWLKSHRACF